MHATLIVNFKNLTVFGLVFFLYEKKGVYVEQFSFTFHEYFKYLKEINCAYSLLLILEYMQCHSLDKFANFILFDQERGGKWIFHTL